MDKLMNRWNNQKPVVDYFMEREKLDEEISNKIFKSFFPKMQCVQLTENVFLYNNAYLGYKCNRCGTNHMAIYFNHNVERYLDNYEQAVWFGADNDNIDLMPIPLKAILNKKVSYRYLCDCSSWYEINYHDNIGIMFTDKEI